jgi:diketogulonate reductase-like aldo/keto reductase
MGQAAIQWLLAHDEVASVTPTFRTTDDIDEWAAEVPPLTDEEVDRVDELYAERFGVDRDDGMGPEDFRTSVGGDDLRAAGVLPAASADD